MDSYFNINSGSSDSEDDVDYVPEEASDSDPSDNEHCEDEECEPEPKKPKFAAEGGKESAPNANKSTDDVWKNFLDSVKSTPYGKKVDQNVEASTSNEVSTSANKAKSDPKSCLEAAFEKKVPEENDLCPKEITPENVGEKVSSDSSIVPADELKRENSIFPIEPGCEKVEIDVRSGQVNSDSRIELVIDAKKSTVEIKKKPPDVLITGRSGVGSFLNSIANKSKKQSVLDKSLADWKQFKEEEGISKELETFNKGRAGYLERQRFLQKSDILSFENEKKLRNLARKK